MAAVTSIGETPLTGGEASQRPSGMQRRRQWRLNIFRYLVFTVYGLFVALPLLALFRYSLEGNKLGTWSVTAWRDIVSYPGLASAVEVTLELALISSAVMLVLLVPTMIWIKLRVQWFSRTFEFLCLLPLTIPAISLVVGLGPVYNLLQRVVLSALQLFWVYVILALPYAYRALASGLDAIDANTLAEAARSLGARWFTVMFRVIAPNMRQAILNAVLLTSALVLGEFTIAYLLLYSTLQPTLYSISRNTPNATVIFSTSMASLLFTFLLLLIVSYIGRRRRRRG